LFLASIKNLSTLIVSRAPFSPEDLARLHETCRELGFMVLASPSTPPASDVLRGIMQAPDLAALAALPALYHIDVSPPTDARPFFFNQLRLTDPLAMLEASRAPAGVLSGNLAATLTLAIIVVLSAILVVLTIVVPALPSARLLPARTIAGGTAYFLLIGVGFMLVEIGVIERLSIFLGHPVYGLAVGLFGIIVATGAGSLVSDRLPLATPARALAWSYLALLPLWLPAVTQAFEAQGIAVRAAVALAAIAPAGLLMGFGFPTGMRLVAAIDPRPTPWFWAINGAAGVLAAGLAVAVSIALSIDACIWLGAACYLPLGAAATALMSARAPAVADRPVYA
jgi:hypothetical protein